MTGSYPFLNLAKAIGADYGDVLCYVDYLLHQRYTTDYWVLQANSRLSEAQKDQLVEAVVSERVRQQKRALADA